MNSKAALRKGDEGEKKIANILDSNHSFHRLINNLVLLGENGVSHQIDHIYINENGIFVIETKNYYGQIDGQENDSYWTRSYFVRKQKKTVKFHNPLKQNQSHIRVIKRVIGRNYPVYCFVVFAQNNGDSLNLFNVCNADSLLKRIEVAISEQQLSKEEIEKIYQALLINESDITNEQHITNAKNTNQERLNHQKSIRLAIEQKICPECGQKLVIKKGQLVCSMCKYILKI